MEIFTKLCSEFGLAIALVIVLLTAALWLLKLFVSNLLASNKELGDKLGELEREFRAFQSDQLVKTQDALNRTAAAIENFSATLKELHETLKTKPCLLDRKEILGRAGLTA